MQAKFLIFIIGLVIPFFLPHDSDGFIASTMNAGVLTIGGFAITNTWVYLLAGAASVLTLGLAFFSRKDLPPLIQSFKILRPIYILFLLAGLLWGVLFSVFLTPSIGNGFGPTMFVVLVLSLLPLIVYRDLGQPWYLRGMSYIILLVLGFFLWTNIVDLNQVFGQYQTTQDLVWPVYLFLVPFSFVGFILEILSATKRHRGFLTALWSTSFIALFSMIVLTFFVMVSLSIMCAHGC